MRQALVRLLCGYPPIVPRPKSDPTPIPNPRQPRPPRKPDGGGLGGRPPDPQTTQTPGNPDPQTNLITLRGADWAGGLPRGRGASAAPAPLAAAGGGLATALQPPRRVADDRAAFDVPGPGRRLIAREREVKSDQTRAPSGRGQGGGCWVLIKRRAKKSEDFAFVKRTLSPWESPEASPGLNHILHFVAPTL